MRVACVTCHRGVKAPHTLPQLLTKALEEGGVEAMAAKYGDLRQEYYGRAAYDFGEKTLMLMATDVETDVGLRMLRMNLEYYPESSDTYVQLGNLLIQSGDKDGGIAALEKAIELDPRNRWARQQLRRAKGDDYGASLATGDRRGYSFRHVTLPSVVLPAEAAEEDRKASSASPYDGGCPSAADWPLHARTTLTVRPPILTP